mmetsp:Transcript_16283/g.27527  ORF Transcript_16283/g.27527 Transcript_16283/m.27527 type:complete len:122 (+) Transcript_16283:1138-1503(+)
MSRQLDEMTRRNSYVNSVAQSSNIVSNIVHKGELRKKNKYLMKQVRYFTLSDQGEIKYYRDRNEYRGNIWLTNKSKVFKTARDTFEIHSHSRVYYIEECDAKKNTIDEWVKMIDSVIKTLQ